LTYFFKRVKYFTNNSKERKMADKLLFDTLNYAKMLEREGVRHGDIHALALSYAVVTEPV